MGNCLSKSATAPISDAHQVLGIAEPSVPHTVVEASKKHDFIQNRRDNEESGVLSTNMDAGIELPTQGPTERSHAGPSGGANDGESTDLSEAKNLLSTRVEMKKKPELVTSRSKSTMLDLGIQVIDSFQKVTDLIGLTVPDYLGPVLETISGVLQRLKVGALLNNIGYMTQTIPDRK
jgi:hypothetical protein